MKTKWWLFKKKVSDFMEFFLGNGKQNSEIVEAEINHNLCSYFIWQLEITFNSNETIPNLNIYSFFIRARR